MIPNFELVLRKSLRFILIHPVMLRLETMNVGWFPMLLNTQPRVWQSSYWHCDLLFTVESVQNPAVCKNCYHAREIRVRCLKNSNKKVGHNMDTLYRKYYACMFLLITSGFAHAGFIELGMSTALSGPNQYLGRAMYDGMRSCFDEVNRQGGINGQKIRLTVLDDSYQPDSAFENTLKLIDQHRVIAIVGNVGTPTAARVAPEANARGVVFYGAYTGADILRKSPPEPFVFNFRASYQQEMEIIIDHIISQGISPRQIAFFLQDDAYGQAGYDTAKAALAKQGFRYTDQLPVARYQRNSLSIQSAIQSMVRIKPRPQAIIIVGAYRPSAKFIRFMHRVLPETRFYNLSFSGAPALADALAGLYGRIYITQVVPLAGSVVEADFNDRNTIWKEAYLAAQVLVMALKRIPGTISSERLRVSLEKLGSFNFEGAGVLSFSSIDHQASDDVWLAHLGKSMHWHKVERSGGKHWKK